MLRRKKFRPFETIILRTIGLLLVAAGVTGLVLAIQRAHWRLGLASAGLFVLAAIFLVAAKRGRPL